MKRGSRRACAAALLACVWTGAAPAEIVRLTGRFAPPNREASRLRSLAIQRFTGQDGPQMSLAIERALAQPDLDGRVHFDLVSASPRAGGRPEGLFSGNVTTGVEENSFKRKDKRCVDKKDGKCLREEEVEQTCRRRVVDVRADLRIVRSADGRILYSATKPRRDEISWCPGQNPSRTVEQAVSGAIDAIAQDVRMEIAPHTEVYGVRFRESTRDLPRDLVREFKDTVKLSQRDLRAACANWGTLDRRAPSHPSITFDLGVCAEARGDYAEATSYYRRAAPMIGRGPNEATEGLGRVERLQIARDDAAHASRGR